MKRFFPHGLSLFLAACTMPPAPQPPDASVETPGPYPRIPSGGGRVLDTVNIVTVSFPGDTHSAELSHFVDTLVDAQWLPRVAGEYGVRSARHVTHIEVPGAAPAVITEDEVRTLVAQWLNDLTVPQAASAATPYVYAVFFPESTAVMTPSGLACRSNPGTGFHDSTDGAGAQVPYLVLPTCAPRFSGVLTQLDAMELDLARLLVNTATNPSPRNEPAFALTDFTSPWVVLGSEVGDRCWGRTVTIEGHTLQRVWSNAETAPGHEPCVPVDDTVAPFGIEVTPAELQELPDGATLTFTVRGWAARPVEDWRIVATPWSGDFAISARLDKTTINDGQTAELKISVPYPVARGTVGGVMLRSYSEKDIPLWPVTFIVR